MNKSELSDLLAAVTKIAYHAGEIIQNNLDARANPTTKSDGTRVTAADRKSEIYITEALSKLETGFPIVGEEAAEAGTAPDVAGTFWLVDPLDGTHPFIEGKDEYSVNIALIQDHKPVLGVFYYPALKLLAGAAGPGTAFFEEIPGEPQSIPELQSVEEGTKINVVVTNRQSFGIPELAEVLDKYDHHEPIMVPGILKFYWMATGKADLYLRFQKCYEWDLAAGHALLEAVGGRVTTASGAPYLYGAHNFLSPPIIAYGKLES